jgi:hypothetical protein
MNFRSRSFWISVGTVFAVAMVLLAVSYNHGRKAQLPPPATFVPPTVDEILAKSGVKSHHMQPAQTAAVYWSNITWVNLNKDCSTFTPTMFIITVSSLYSTLSPSSLYVVDMVCGSMTVFFRCASTAWDAADLTCSAVKSVIETEYSGLYVSLQTTRPSYWVDDGTSNNGIFALYTLIILPIFCVIGFIVWYRYKQNQADAQYLQDTATFSNAAARQTRPPYDATAYPAPAPMQPVPQVVPAYYPQ